MSEVITTLHEGWAEVVLNRPHRRNAITGPLGDELASTVSELSAGEKVRVILLRGADGAFCSGLDIKEFNAEPPPDWMPAFRDTWRSAHRALFDCPHPIVGALEKYAINGGAALALACDLLVAGDEAFLQIGEVRQGMAAPYNMAWMRLRHSEALTANLALTGRRVRGQELVRLGIATESVADDQVLPRARELATDLASYPSGALARIKALARRYSNAPSADEWFDVATSMDPPGRTKPRRNDAAEE